MRSHRMIFSCAGCGLLLACSAGTAAGTAAAPRPPIITGQSIDSLGLAQRVQRWADDPEVYGLPTSFPVAYGLSESGTVTYIELPPTIPEEMRDSVRAAVMAAAATPPVRPGSPATLRVTLRPQVQVTLARSVISAPVLANRDEFTEILRDIAKRTQIPGRASLWLLVAPNGRVTQAEIDELSGTVVLDQLLLKASESLRFQPATTSDGIRVPTWVHLPMSVTIR